MKTNNRFLFTAVFAAITFTFFACSGDDSPPEQPPSGELSSNSSGGANEEVFCSLTAGTCSQMSLSTCMELVNAGMAQIVQNCSGGIFGYCDYGHGECYPIATDDDAANCTAYGQVVSSCPTTLSSSSNTPPPSSSSVTTTIPSSSSITPPPPSSSSVAQSGTFTDARDGLTYKWVKIGTQTWMAENLSFASSTGNKVFLCNLATVIYVETSSCQGIFRMDGFLYDWAAATGQTSNTTLYTNVPEKFRGICPVGWHLPSDAEWNTLATYVGANAGTKLKSTIGWAKGIAGESNGNGTDDYGFNAEPIGYYTGTGASPTNYRSLGIWWTITQYSNGTHAYNRAMLDTRADITKLGVEIYDYSTLKTNYLSVRCVKD
jgi:uncharacterized protein (TIGR02145 family)